MLYRLVVSVRNGLYNKGIKKSQSADVPTVCVGNITAGGTGKTPHTELILRTLLSDPVWGNCNLSVLSRGYKRRSKGFQQVTTDTAAAFCGDEPLQIKKKFPQVTVAVDKDRIEGCRFLAHPDQLSEDKKASRSCADRLFPAAELVVLDDAFQYRKLKATCNIILVDYNRPLYKDRFLPFGRLRDLPSRIAEADIIIVTKCPVEMDKWEKTTVAESLGISNFMTSSCSGRARNGKEQFVLFTHIEYEPFKPMFERSDKRYIYSQRLVLFTGIARDEQLKMYLSDHYKIVRKFSFSDHHAFTMSDFHRIQGAVNQWPTAAVATTEKDAQRVLDFRGLPPGLPERMFQIPIKVEFLSEEEEQVFRRELLSRINQH